MFIEAMNPFLIMTPSVAHCPTFPCLIRGDPYRKKTLDFALNKHTVQLLILSNFCFFSIGGILIEKKPSILPSINTLSNFCFFSIRGDPYRKKTLDFALNKHTVQLLILFWLEISRHNHLTLTLTLILTISIYTTKIIETFLLK